MVCQLFILVNFPLFLCSIIRGSTAEYQTCSCTKLLRRQQIESPSFNWSTHFSGLHRTLLKSGKTIFLKAPCYCRKKFFANPRILSTNRKNGIKIQKRIVHINFLPIIRVNQLRRFSFYVKLKRELKKRINSGQTSRNLCLWFKGFSKPLVLLTTRMDRFQKSAGNCMMVCSKPQWLLENNSYGH
jgi:hypothetical protein